MNKNNYNKNTNKQGKNKLIKSKVIQVVCKRIEPTLNIEFIQSGCKICVKNTSNCLSHLSSISDKQKQNKSNLKCEIEQNIYKALPHQDYCKQFQQKQEKLQKLKIFSLTFNLKIQNENLFINQEVQKDSPLLIKKNFKMLLQSAVIQYKINKFQSFSNQSQQDQINQKGFKKSKLQHLECLLQNFRSKVEALQQQKKQFESIEKQQKGIQTQYLYSKTMSTSTSQFAQNQQVQVQQQTLIDKLNQLKDQQKQEQLYRMLLIQAIYLDQKISKNLYKNLQL